MIKLDIPYRSQWDNDARDHSADCGPTCLAMVLNYFGVDITPDGVYKHIPGKGPKDFTSIQEMIRAGNAENVQLERKQFGPNDALRHLRANVDAGNVMIALVSYAPWKPITGNQFTRGHFVVVTGYDDDHVYINDPLFGLWVDREQGASFSHSNADFAAGWGGFDPSENPNWVCIVTSKETAPAPVVSEPVPQPTQTPQAPGGQANQMDDVNRRVLALAAYRWAEAPDVDNPEEMKVWLDNLGDWGLEYDEYVVQSGDTLSGLAQRFYGEQQRWHAIEAYNDMGTMGLWAGKKLLIPRLGNDNAHKNPALPHDTTDFAKGLELGMLVDPELEALDYDADMGSTKGIGF